MKSLLNIFTRQSSTRRRPTRRFRPRFQALETRRLFAADVPEMLPLEQVRSDAAVFASFDLETEGSAEAKIRSALEQTDHLEFIDMPLDEVIQSIEDQFGVTIVLPESSDGQPNVNFTSTNVSLRSALRLMLRDLDMTYVVNNEVLQITTIEAETEEMTTRVYPVGDLVVPIDSIGGQVGSGGGLGG